MNDNPIRNPKTESTLAAQIGHKAERKIIARSSTQGVWFGLGMMGLIGWSVVVPTLIGAAIGIWIDGRHRDQHSWTLALLVAGLSLGCLNTWHWVSNENNAMHQQDEHDDE